MSRLSRISWSKKTRPAAAPVQDLGGGQFDLLDGQFPVVVGLVVGDGERVREAGQPLADEPRDLLRGHAVADLLYRVGVVDRSERVVRRGEPDPGRRHCCLAYSWPLR